MIAIDGKKNGLKAIWGGDLSVYSAVYCGDERVWPDVTKDGGFLIKIPNAGTLDFLYWLHAVSATEDATMRKQGAFMRFVVNGITYYINSGPEGEETVSLDGDVLSLTTRQMEQIIPHLNDTLTVNCHVPVREGASLHAKVDGKKGGTTKKTWFLPLLPKTTIKARAHKGGREEPAKVGDINITGLPSGRKYLEEESYTAGGEGRYYFSETWEIESVNLTDTSMEGTLDFWGSADYYRKNKSKQGLWPIYPEFTKTFTLEVVAIS